MKNIIYTSALLLLIVSCKKKEDEVIIQQVQTPGYVKSDIPVHKTYNEFLKANFLDYDRSTTNAPQNEEMGYCFTPKYTMIMDTIYVRVPGTNSSMRVTLWSVKDSTAIYTDYINVNQNTQTVKFNCLPIGLAANEEYVLSMNTEDWLIREVNTDSIAEIQFPYQAGDIVYNWYGFSRGSSQEIPTEAISKTAANGDIWFSAH